MKKLKILLDNGHGVNTPGKRSPLWITGTQLFEWYYTREITKRVKAELIAVGIDAELIVPEDEDVSLGARCRRVNQIAKEVGVKNCLLVSIHCNGFNGKARGWEVHTYLGQSTSDVYATVFWNIAKQILQNDTIMRGDHSDGDPDWDSNFAILRDTSCAALLTENLFMDNQKDCDFVLSDEGKDAIVEIHVKAILKIVGDE